MFLNILIAHYKEPDWMIQRLLESLATQDLSNVAVSIYNDGEDNVISNTLLQKYPFVSSYTVCEHMGTSKLRNKMIAETNSDYFWFVDSDDFLLPEALAKVKTKLSEEDLDLLSVGCIWDCGTYKTYYCPHFTDYSVVGLNIFKRQWFLKNKLWCDESCPLVGDILIETLPKWYTDKKDFLLDQIYYYSYNSNSTVHSKTNNWKQYKFTVICHCIERLLLEHRPVEAYAEYKTYILLYNSIKMFDKYKDFFKALGLFDLNYKLDLREDADL